MLGRCGAAAALACQPRPLPSSLLTHACRCLLQVESAYGTLRLERMNARMAGVRAKRAAEAEAAAKDA